MRGHRFVGSEEVQEGAKVNAPSLLGRFTPLHQQEADRNVSAIVRRLTTEFHSSLITALLRTATTMSYTIKTAKPKKRGKGARPLPQELCDSEHCITQSGHCTSRSCADLLASRLHDLKNENIGLSLAFDSRNEAFDKLEREMGPSFSVTNLSTTTETFRYLKASTAAIKSANRAANSVECSCTTCSIMDERSETEAWRKKLSSVETKMDVLREHKAANDTEVIRLDTKK